MAKDAQRLEVPRSPTGPSLLVGGPGGLSLLCAGAEQAARWVWWVPKGLGQGQCTPGLLAQGPAEASLGAQGCGGEGKVLGLEFELQVAGGQGVICLAGGLGGDAGPGA